MVCTRTVFLSAVPSVTTTKPSSSSTARQSVTIKCASCSLTWAVEIASLPPKVLKLLSAIKRAS